MDDIIQKTDFHKASSLTEVVENKEFRKKNIGSVVKDATPNEDGSISFYLVTNSLDRDKEIVEPQGAIIENYKNNPVWLWAHNYQQPSIGKVKTDTIEITNEHLKVDVLFDEKNDEFAKMVAEKHRNGFLNACSVGFMPIEWIAQYDNDEVPQNYTISKYEVWEGSSVPVPANPDALNLSAWYQFIEKGIKSGRMTDDQIRNNLTRAGWDEYLVKWAVPKIKIEAKKILEIDLSNLDKLSEYRKVLGDENYIKAVIEYIENHIKITKELAKTVNANTQVVNIEISKDTSDEKVQGIINSINNLSKLINRKDGNEE